MSLSTTSKWFLNTSMDGDSTTSLGSLFQCLTTLSVKKCFLISNLNLLPLAQLKAISCLPVTCHQWEETNPALAVSTFPVLEESNNVSPQPPFPQSKQPQFPQLLTQSHPVRLGLVSSHFWQVSGQGEMDSSCTRVSWGWIFINTSLQKGFLSTGIGSPGRWLSHHPWKCLKTIWMWCSGTWFSGGLLELG